MMSIPIIDIPGGEDVSRKKLETLTEQMYYVLLALWAEPRHGYGIMQYVDRLTQGRVAVGAGTLYALLARFEEEKLIFFNGTQEGRKYYILSDEGRRTLQEEYRRLGRQLADGATLLDKEEP